MLGWIPIIPFLGRWPPECAISRSLNHLEIWDGTTVLYRPVTFVCPRWIHPALLFSVFFFSLVHGEPASDHLRPVDFILLPY